MREYEVAKPAEERLAGFGARIGGCRHKVRQTGGILTGL